MRTAYIYILHFHDRLHHARHYAGCTTHLLQRLTVHAHGAGARITAVCLERGIEWELGSLMTCSFPRMRELERKLKDLNNSPAYCGLCNKVPSTLPGCRHMDPRLLPFTPHSRQLRAGPCRVRNGLITYRLCNEADRFTLQPQILAMMRADKDALGFIPIGGEAGLDTLFPRGQIALALQDDTLLGYAAFTIPLNETLPKIQQCVVADGARLAGIGRHLIELVDQTTPNAGALKCAVRDDLAANHFWQAIGFTNVGSTRHKTSGSTLNHYLRPKKRS